MTLKLKKKRKKMKKGAVKIEKNETLNLKKKRPIVLMSKHPSTQAFEKSFDHGSDFLLSPDKSLSLPCLCLWQSLKKNVMMTPLCDVVKM